MAQLCHHVRRAAAARRAFPNRAGAGQGRGLEGAYQGPQTGDAVAMSWLLTSSKPTLVPAFSASIHVLISCRPRQATISEATHFPKSY